MRCTCCCLVGGCCGGQGGGEERGKWVCRLIMRWAWSSPVLQKSAPFSPHYLNNAGKRKKEEWWEREFLGWNQDKLQIDVLRGELWRNWKLYIHCIRKPYGKPSLGRLLLCIITFKVRCKYAHQDPTNLIMKFTEILHLKVQRVTFTGVCCHKMEQKTDVCV